MNKVIKFYLFATIVFMGLGLWLSKVNQPFVATICIIMGLVQLFLLLAEKNFDEKCHAYLGKEHTI